MSIRILVGGRIFQLASYLLSAGVDAPAGGVRRHPSGAFGRSRVRVLFAPHARSRPLADPQDLEVDLAARADRPNPHVRVCMTVAGNKDCSRPHSKGIRGVGEGRPTVTVAVLSLQIGDEV